MDPLALIRLTQIFVFFINFTQFYPAMQKLVSIRLPEHGPGSYIRNPDLSRFLVSLIFLSGPLPTAPDDPRYGAWFKVMFWGYAPPTL